MKKLLFISLILLLVNSAFTQATYTFTGTGNWTDTANWQNDFAPPGILPPGSTIIIDHANGGECVLDKAQTIAAGATFTILPGKFFRVTGSLFMAPVLPTYKLHGIGFSPYYDGENPDYGSQISESQISYMLQRVAPFTEWVRSYGSTDGLEKIAINAHRQNLKVAAGAWLNNNTTTNQAEISNLIAMGQAGEIEIAVVGNEVLERGDLTSSQLIGYINQVKAALPNIPVTTADNFNHLLAHPDVMNAVDIIFVHIHPFWNGISIDCATNFVDSIYRSVKDSAHGKEVIIGETGWPGEGLSRGRALPSSVNASTFFLHFTSWAQIKQVKYFYFEAFDESWKAGEPHGVGPHWGLWEKNAGILKPGMNSVFDGVTIPDNWVLDTIALTSVDTTITLTIVPPICSYLDLEGKVTGVFPPHNRVAVFIYANGWWNKPDFNQLTIPLQCDGSFLCDITTDNDMGMDKYATAIRVYLVPKTYTPPELHGSPTIPPEVEQIALAWAEVPRLPVIPILTTSSIDSIALTTAVCGGNITCHGGAAMLARGVCWNTTGNPTTSDPKTTDGNANGNFTSHITGLNANTTYYVKAYATNTTGTAYGNVIIFKTAYGLPALTTTSISNFPGTTAMGGGNITDDGGTQILARGVCWAVTQNPTTANAKTTDIFTGTGEFTNTVSGLMPNTVYYLRAYATTAAGTAYGNQISFTTTQNSSFSIGQTHQGGIIFYIDGSGQHGLVAASGDLSAMQWYNGSFITTNATSVTDGSDNTDKIINIQGNTGQYAAKACRDVGSNWFLPSKDQLNILYSVKNIVGGFENDFYWSSTEINNVVAWIQHFFSGLQSQYSKAETIRVRAIRAF